MLFGGNFPDRSRTSPEAARQDNSKAGSRKKRLHSVALQAFHRLAHLPIPIDSGLDGANPSTLDFGSHRSL